MHAALLSLVRQAALPDSRLQRFEECGRTAWILRHRTEPDRYRIALDCCHDRFCVPCGNGRAAVVAENLSRKLSSTPHRLLTLTLKSSDTPLGGQLDRLLRSFKRLRARLLWRERCDGGAAFLELAYNVETHRWHPHLHVIIQGRFLPHAFLKSAWLDITGDSTVVDIRPIRNTEAIVKYVTKYVTKPLPAHVYAERDALTAALLALHGRKTLFCFGCWSRWQLLDPHDSHDWTLYAHANELAYMVSQDDDLALEVSAHFQYWMHNDGPLDFRVRGPPPDPDRVIPYDPNQRCES